MKLPCYIGLDEARSLLAEMGVELNDRQIKRAAETDIYGRRKLPFFVDPIDGRLKIEKQSLVDIYRQAQIDAENSLRD